MKRPEQDVQRAVFQHLRARAGQNVFCFHCPNGGRRSRIEASIFKGLGVVAGVPDLICIKDGRTYGLELKAENGRTTSIQEGVLNKMFLAGAQVAVAYGLNEAIAWLEHWGILRGTAQVSHKPLPSGESGP